MTPQEWGIIAAFIAAVYGLSFVSPQASFLLAAFIAGVSFYRAIPKLTRLIGA